MNKKGMSGVLVIFVIILFLLSGLGFYYRNNVASWFAKEKQSPIGTMVVKAQNSSGEITADILVGHFNCKGTECSDIIVSYAGNNRENGSYTEFNIPLDKELIIFSRAEGHYNGKQINPYPDITQIKKERIVTLLPFGSVEINNLSSLNAIEGVLTLNLTTKGELFFPYFCVARTFGISEAYIKGEQKYCYSNWTKYENYTLPSNVWGCGINPNPETFEQCGNVNGTICFKDEVKPSTRLKNSVDACYMTGLKMEDNQNIVNIHYKKRSDIEVLCSDSVELWIVDNVQEWGKIRPNIIDQTPEGKDVGSPDIIKEFKVC